jgi:uncharacterized protein YuzE
METLKLLDKKQKIQWDYDEEADVLYISFGKPQKAEGVDIGEGIIIRVLPDTHRIVGLTIINPIKRTLKELNIQTETAE